MSKLLADDLGLPADEIAAFAAIRYGWDIDDATDEEAAAIRLDLDSELCVRSVPQYWWPPEWPDAKICRCRALGGLEHAPGPGCPLPSRQDDPS